MQHWPEQGPRNTWLVPKRGDLEIKKIDRAFLSIYRHFPSCPRSSSWSLPPHCTTLGEGTTSAKPDGQTRWHALTQSTLLASALGLGPGPSQLIVLLAHWKRDQHPSDLAKCDPSLRRDTVPG